MNAYFATEIEKWFARCGRDLPWRGTQDPYRIWISEIILQQTRVVQGWQYFLRFMERFPDVESLARATEDEVLRLWQGLGYYSRARNLHAAAQQVVQMGGFPQTYDDILQLRGVGEYTAAAIASFAFGQPCAVLDGNVYRVLSRYLGIDTPIDTTLGKKTFRALADEMLDTAQPALYNQAIMDFGAVQCTPQSPLCDECPLMDSCAARAQQRVDELPVKSHTTHVRDRYFTYFYIEDEHEKVLIQRRPAGDIWQGLYQFPLIESDHPLTPHEASLQVPGTLTLLRQGITHQLSHQTLHADIYALQLSIDSQVPFQGLWISRQELSDYAFPRLLSKFIEQNLAI